MNALLAWFNPTRWIALGVVVAVVVSGYLWHRHSLIEIGRAECEAEHKIAAAAAAKVQAGQDAAATKEVIVTETITETKYKDRIKEVIRYVPTSGTVCPADPEFVRLFNSQD